MLRYAELSLSGEPSGPIFGLFHDEPDVSIALTRYLEPVENGQHIGLTDIVGDLDAARNVLETYENVLQYDMAETDDRGTVYARYRSIGSLRDLLDILYHRNILLDWPIEHRTTVTGPEVRFEIIGTDEGIRRATADLPEQVTVSVERVGRYEPSPETDSVLTDEQAALLRLAIEMGYYDVPKRTTQEEIAEELGVTSGTAGDRLQRLERRVMRAHAERLRRQ